jgi:hypothetical protein
MKPHVVISSVIANKPFNGGNARMVLNWLEGFRRLDAEVFFVEQISSQTCVDATGAGVAASDSENRRYFDRVLGASGFRDRAVLICDAHDALDRATILGATAGELRDLAADADLLINISGHLDIAGLKHRFRRRAYVDLDPGYTQLWHAQGSNAARLDGHDLYFTVGARIGTPSCTVPTGGLAWQPLRPPIVLAGCSLAAPREPDRFTTVASWRGAYAPISHEGDTLGNKAHEFRKIVNLPRLSRRSFEVALDIHPADGRDLNALCDCGWQVVDPRGAVATPDDYCDYIEASAAECSAAQGMYVKTGCGWFSDRTARYLASGKPALVQDTGFAMPEGGDQGLLLFDTVEAAARGAEEIARNYRAHSEAARSIAERYFDSDTELARVMEQAGLP